MLFCSMDIRDRLAGALLGTALGDALGLACEGISATAIARRFGPVERFHLLGTTGFVSDDTEQSALVAHALAAHPADLPAFIQSFRRSLLFWFLRLPFGIGLATMRACLRILFGFSRTGVRSAGNGAAMRAGIVGVFFRDDEEKRRRFGTALAEVTHTDPRAVQGALYVAEVAAAAARAPAGATPLSCQQAARLVVTEPSLAAALDAAGDLAARGVDDGEAAKVLGSTGFILHTAALATFLFLRHGQVPMQALQKTVNAGGDTDSIGAIVGAWVGALHGETGLSQPLLARIQDGPFGPTHLRALANALAVAQGGGAAPRVRYSATLALLRNLALYPVVLAHGLRRLLPF